MINQKYREQETPQGEELKEEELIEAPEPKEDDVEKLTEEEIEAEYARYQAILKRRSEMEGEGKADPKKKMQFEIEYDYFFTHFWQANVLKRYYNPPASPMMVWSEIMSTIKGNPNVYLHDNQWLSRDHYLESAASKNTMIAEKNKRWIYDIFLDYEGWKDQQGGYDFMDVVNHVLKQIHNFGYNGTPIHFLMIDEVQDLSPATLFLLMKVTEQGVFFAGDTAQTIAKGVGIRFCDLSTLFDGTGLYTKPTVHQLTVKVIFY